MMQHQRSSSESLLLIDTSIEHVTMNKILAATTSPLTKSSLVHPDKVSSLLQKVLWKVRDGENAYMVLRSMLLQKGGDNSKADLVRFDFSMTAFCGNHTKELILCLPYIDIIKAELGGRKFIMCIECFEDGAVSELTHAEHCIVHDDIFLDNNAFEKLKGEDRKTWEFKWGSLEYSRTSQRIVQAVLSLDLQLEVGSVRNITSNAMSISAGWSRAVSSGDHIIHVLKRLLEGDSTISRDFVFKERKQTSALIQCTVSNKKWGHESYGVGMILHYTSVVDVFWTSKEGDDLFKDNGEDCITSCIFTVECCSSQGFPLFCISDDSFSDCCSKVPLAAGSAPDSLLVDYELGTTSITFHEPLHTGPFHYGISREEILSNGVKDNHKYRKSLRETIDELASESSPPSFENETFAWGDNANECLGIQRSPNKGGETLCIDPTPMLFNQLSARENINSVECSSCHVIALTNMGTVYSCGDGSHGQLGHGELEYCRYLRLISAFVDSSGERILITAISAGSDETSSHSAAIDSNNNLFTWGKSIVCGHVFGEHRECTLPKKLNTLEGFNTIKVSCGSGYTLALVEEYLVQSEMETTSSKREVLAWGVVSHGRLGTGKPQREVEINFFGNRKLKDPKRYDSEPSIIPRLTDKNIVGISAGTDHALALSDSGEVFAWGSNSLGQCGAIDLDPLHLRRIELQRHRDRYNGTKEDKAPNLWDDVWLPRIIPQFGPSTGVVIKSVSAGGIHSAAIDRNGLVYTWGGGGNSNCLGHGEISSYEFGNSEKNDSLRRQVLAMSGHLRIPKWAIPRSIKSLKEDKISQISLGRAHCAAVSSTGSIFVWGDETMEIQKKIAHREDDHEMGGIGDINTNDSTAVPIKPNELIFQPLEGKRIHHVACGTNSTFCIASDDAMGRSLGSMLFKSIREEETLKSTIDCVLIAGGRRLYCHRVIIAQRSNVLNQMLMMRDNPQDFSSMTELVITGIHYDVMKSIMCFIYTDYIPNLNLLAFETLLNIWHAAKRLNLQKLTSKCRQILDVDHGYKIDDSSDEYIEGINRPLPSFASDMSRALEDKRFADISLLIEGKVVYAHECIIRCASNYFGLLLDNARTESNSLTTLEITGTYAQGVRLLYYLYTGFLPPSSTEMGTYTYSETDLVDGLVNAHRYQLKELKSYCDSTIIVTHRNATNMLLLGIRTNSTRLKIQSMNLIAKNLGNQVENETLRTKFFSALAQCPLDVKDDIFEMIKDAKGIGCIISQERKDLASSMIEISTEQKTKMEEKMANDLVRSEADGLSMRNIFILMVLLVAYVSFQKVVSLGAFVPIVNALVLLMTAVNLVHRIQ